jgi:hypothetical protein
MTRTPLSDLLTARPDEFPTGFQPCTVAGHRLTLVAALQRTAVVEDPEHLDRGRWVEPLGLVLVDGDALTWQRRSQYEFAVRRASQRGRRTARKNRQARGDA